MTDDLSEFVPFLLYRIIAKGAQLAGTEFAQLNLTIRQARILIVLLHNEGVGVSALSGLADIEQSALSHMLKKIEASDLICRERQAQDNRSVHIRLTLHGRRIARKCQQLSAKHSAILMDGMSEADAEMLKRLLRQIYGKVADWENRQGLAAETKSDREEVHS